MKSLAILILFIGLAAAQRQLGNSIRGKHYRRYNELSSPLSSTSSSSSSSSSESREFSNYKKLLKNSKCNIKRRNGSKNVSNESRIIGGTEASRNQFPFQVLLFTEEDAENCSLCGGSIISVNYVLTAAHCLAYFIRSHLLAGIHNFETDRPLHELTIFPADVTKHVNYNPITEWNDIAVVSTKKKPFIFNNPAVQPIVIAPRSFTNANLVGMSNTISGWGATKDNGTYSAALRFIDTPAISNLECSKYYETGLVLDTNYCISGANGRSTCIGDSGGGAIVVNGNTRVLLGILSFGTESCQKGNPDVMTRITSYHNWITQVTGITIN